MTAHATTLVSVEKYLYMLEKSDVKLEYRAGKVVAMAGAQAPHNIIAMNFAGELFACLKKAGCQIVGSDQLVKIEACNRYTLSLKEYVLVASTKKQVEVFRRHNHNEWILHIYDENDNLVKIGNCEVSLDDIYNNVEMPVEE